jgi:Ca-activated chloride channel family protein
MRHPRKPPTLFIAAALLLVACGSGADSDYAPPPGPEEPDARGGEQVSTFALDVDTASFDFTARTVADGRWPAPDTIRPEEFVNSIIPPYAQPSGDGVTIHVDGARLPWSHSAEPPDDFRLLRVGLATRDDEAAQRPDAALTFVIDISGSMAEPGRLDLVRDALHTMVDQLRPTDSVAVVTFSDVATVEREMTFVSDSAELHSAIDRLEPQQRTNLEAGLTVGYRVARDGFRARASNRVVILSDGLANVGSTTATPIVRQIREEAAGEITLLGVGVGSDYGDALMEQLTNEGDGYAVYVSDRERAREVFVRDLPAALAVRAHDAKAQVSFEEAAVRGYHLLGYENRLLDTDGFRDDAIDGGELGPGHTVTAIYLIQLDREAGPDERVASVRVRWRDPVGNEPAEAFETVTVGDLATDFATGDPYLQVGYAAGRYAELIRGGTQSAAGDQLAELATIVERAYHLTGDRAVGRLLDVVTRTAGL